MHKSELRKKFLERRRALGTAAIATASGKIADRFFDHVDLDKVSNLHTYIRIAKFAEVDTSMIYFRIWRDYPAIRTFAPRLDSLSMNIESVDFNERCEMRENRWGIREPLGKNTVPPEELDVVIIPLLCFDERGYRVGYGKGIYDRFLARCGDECLKVGLSYFPAVDEIEDTDGYDIALDICVTPDEAYRWNVSEAVTCLAS